MRENWIIPCNLKHFDVIEHFKNNKYVIWKNSFTIRKGDIACIYIGAPIGEIRYKCEVISNEVDQELLTSNSYAIVEKQGNNYFSKKIKYIQLKLLREYPSETFTLQKLREHGLGQVQIQARTDRRLQSFISSIDEKENANG